MPTGTIECPFCSEEIKESAIKCRHCGEFLNDSDTVETTDTDPGMRRQPPHQRRGTGDLNVPPPRRGTTGKLRKTGPLWPTIDDKTKQYVAVGTVLPLLGGFFLSLHGSYVGMLILFGVPGLLVLFDSANRYKRPSWLLALLAPLLWMTAIAYVIKRFIVQPDLVPKAAMEQQKDRRLWGLPKPWQAAVASSGIALLCMAYASGPSSSRSSAVKAPTTGAQTAAQAPHQAEAPVEQPAPPKPVEKPKSYETYRSILNRFKGMTEVQQKAWNQENEWRYWVKGVGTIENVEEAGVLSGISGDYYEVTVEMSEGDRAVVFYPKDKYKDHVLGMSKGNRIEFEGNLQRLHNLGFWYSGDIRAE